MEMLGLMVNEPRLTPRQLATLEVPVLVIAGTRDMIKRSHTEALARAVDDFLRHLQEKEE